jgi:hypothetical protein
MPLGSPLESIADFVCSRKHFGDIIVHLALLKFLLPSSAVRIILGSISLAVFHDSDSKLSGVTHATTLTLEGSEVHNALAHAYLI